MLEVFIFILNGALQPVLTIQVHHHAALVEAVLALEFCLHDEGEELLVGADLQNRGVVIAEMVVGALPQVSVRQSDDLDPVVGNGGVLGCASPLPVGCFELHVRVLL